MTWAVWFADNWFTGLQSLGIVGGFVFTGVTLRRDEKSRRVANLFNLTAHHRELWAYTFTQPALRRVLSPHPDLAAAPITEDESLFVGFLILHLNSAYRAIKRGLMEEPEGLATDIRIFFARPIPRSVWIMLRPMQDADFISFVEGHFRSFDS